jgi:hypothetical protein
MIVNGIASLKSIWGWNDISSGIIIKRMALANVAT